jgi:hypothetical protein
VPGPVDRARLCGRAVTSPKGHPREPGAFAQGNAVGAAVRVRAPPDQSAKFAPKYGDPVPETPEVLGEIVREPEVVIFVPSEGR